MNILLHLLSHAVLLRHQKNLKNIRSQLDASQHAHAEGQKQHERLILLYSQLHQAMKLHSFRRDLLEGMKDVKEDKTRERVEGLMGKLKHIESEEKQLAQEIARKTQIHSALTSRINRLQKELDEVILVVGKETKK
ncbi:hypothetical protein HZC09_06980 [Candidatus Micrarchaeota archaeon]|nr:hypothetical protein [Candidatus Micrarchaeota archaeon]